MNEDEAMEKYAWLEHKRQMMQRLLIRTRDRLQALIEEVQHDPQAQQEKLDEMARLTFLGKLWARILADIADEAMALTLQITNENKKRRARMVAPTIDPSELQVPDYMPENLT